MQTDPDLTTMSDLLAEEKNEAEGNGQSDYTDKDSLGLEDMVYNDFKEYVNKYYRMNKDVPIYLDFTAIAPADGEYYFNYAIPTTSDESTVYVDDIQISHASAGTYFSQIHRLGTFRQGDVIKVTIAVDGNTCKYLNAYFGYFDNEAFDSQFDTIDKTKVTVNTACDGYVNLTANIEDDDIVITTVPYEKGWTLYIDGKEAEITPYQGAFIAFDVPSGSHTCELKFIAPGFKPGVIVSAAGVLGMIIFAVVDMSMKKKKPVEKAPAQE